MIPIFSSHSAIPGDDSLIQVQLHYPEGTGSNSIRAWIFWASIAAISFIETHLQSFHCYCLFP